MNTPITAKKRLLFLSIVCTPIFFAPLYSASFTTIRSGSWNDPTIWDLGTVPATLDKVTIAYGTTVSVTPNSRDYSDCDSLIINGFLDVGKTNLTIGGRDLQIDVRAVRNTSCIINGRLRIAGDWTHQFKVYGHVKFNMGSTFEMTAGQMMVDGSGFTEVLSVPADKAILDVTDATNFSTTGGLIVIWSPHFHLSGVTIKGAKHFHAVSFGNNLSLATFACRNPNDFVISETDKPIFDIVQVAYLPHPNRQNQVVLNDVSMMNLTIRGGVLVGTGRAKISEQVLIGPAGRIERDIELNGSWQQNISTFEGNTSTVIKGNIYVNNPHRIKNELNLDIQNGTIHFLQGKFDLTDKTVTVSTAPTGATVARYFISHNYSSNVGTLVIKNIGVQTLFPVGTENDYLPVTLSALGGDFSVSARPLSIGGGTDYFSINTEWDIKRVAGNHAADVQVQWNAVNELPSFANYRQNCRIFHSNGSSWQALSNGYGITKQEGSTFKKVVQSISNFSTFTVLTQTVKPSSIPKFLGRKGETGVELVWEMPFEKNNVGFTIQKSKEGRVFEPLAFVEGEGNSNVPRTYDFMDTEAWSLAYYRLKQEDFDGSFEYSPVIVVGSKTSKAAVSAYPNPVANASFVSLNISGKAEGEWDLTIVSVSGQVVYQKTKVLAENVGRIPIGDLATGIYFIQLTNGWEKMTCPIFR